jgi:hypothetical protein
VDADGVTLRRVPGEIQACGSLFSRADSIFPVVGRHEVAAGVADKWDLEVTDQLGDIASHACAIRRFMVRFEDASVDSPTEVLQERAVEAVVDA